MKTGKLIIYNILMLFAIFTILHIHLSSGLNAFEYSKEYLNSIIGIILLISVNFTVLLFINLSYIVTYSKTKKNLLRVSLLITILLFVGSLVMRIIEYLGSTFYKAGNIIMLIYLILIVLNISILKDLYILIKKLFNQNN